MKSFRTQRASIWLTALALILLCGVAIAPLLRGVMPETADGTIHLYRLPVLDHAFDDGSLFPRYPVATVYGYGSPIFNFYSPLSLYPMHFLHFFDMDYLNSWLYGMALYVIVAAVGAYLLGRTWGGSTVGVATAAAYVYAPYFIYDFLWRGTTSETAALAILPYVLWAIKTQADHPSRRTFLAVILSLALFIPMHNIMAVFGGAMIAFYSLFVVVTARDRLRAGMRVFGAVALGVLMATFYWLPALRETANIKIDAITDSLPEIDVTRNLGSVWDALRPPYPADPSLQQPPFAIALGWPQILFAVMGLFTVPRLIRRLRGLVIIAALGVLFLLFMLTPASAVIWKTLPFIGYSQYPTRMLGPASLLLALVAGFGVDRFVSPALRLNGRLLRMGLPLALMMIFTLPLGVRTPLPEHNPQSVVDSLDFEVESGFVGSASFGEYVPVWTAVLPDQTDLRDLYAQSTFIPRLRPPEGVSVTNDSWRHTSGAFDVQADVETVLTLDWLYMPYFQATLDGNPLPVAPSADEGRVTVTVPAGNHRVEVWLAPSRTQAIATIVSLTALMATVGILGLWPLLRGKPAVTYLERFEVTRDSRRAVIAAALAGVAMLGVKLAYDQLPNPLRQERFASDYSAGVQHVTDVNFGREITLIGYDAPSVAVQPASTADYTLYWTPRLAEITRDYITVFVVRTGDGQEISRTNDDRPGGIETHHWRQGQYQRQHIGVEIPPFTPPATYAVSVQLYDRLTATSLDIINEADNPVGVEIPLGSVEVVRGADIPVTAENWPFADEMPDAPLSAGGLILYGYDSLPDEAAAGDVLDMRFLWGIESAGDAPDVSLRWAYSQNAVVEQTPVRLDGVFPLVQWQTGDIWMTAQRLYVPAVLDGEVSVSLEVNGRTAFSQQMTVHAPERSFDLPADVQPADAAWDNGITLAAYTISDDEITLYWQMSGVLQTDLRRFAHILMADGSMLSVYDGIPAEWSRPVSSWIIGEYVIDRIPLTATTGQTLRLGFYDAATGSRISTSTGDVVDIPVP